MNYRTTLLTGIIFAGLAVAVGAFGAHALRDTLERNGRADTYELAVRYQFYHAFALIICGMLMRSFETAAIRWAPVCFSLGIVFFSGSLYILSLTGVTTFGAITPIGGLMLLTGWGLMAVAVAKRA